MYNIHSVVIVIDSIFLTCVYKNMQINMHDLVIKRQQTRVKDPIREATRSKIATRIDGRGTIGKKKVFGLQLSVAR